MTSVGLEELRAAAIARQKIDNGPMFLQPSVVLGLLDKIAVLDDENKKWANLLLDIEQEKAATHGDWMEYQRNAASESAALRVVADRYREALDAIAQRASVAFAHSEGYYSALAKCESLARRAVLVEERSTRNGGEKS